MSGLAGCLRTNRAGATKAGSSQPRIAAMRVSPIACLLSLLFTLPAITTAATDKVYKWTDENGVTHFSQDPPKGERYEERDVRVPPAARRTPEEEARDAPVKPESDLCLRVRANLKALEDSDSVNMDLDGDGEAELLSEAQRATQLDIARKQIDIYCRPQPPQPEQP